MSDKITYSCDRDGVTISVTHEGDHSIGGYVDAYRQFLLAVGFLHSQAESVVFNSEWPK